MTDRAHKASAHLVIARDGKVTQLVPFDRIAWHAGDSRWLGLSQLNRFSIGIELDNAGALERQGSAWRAWFGRADPDEQVLEAAHKHEQKVRGWHLYTEPQINAATDAARAIVDHYALLDVLGHDDIAPGRKSDPGPASPMDSFCASVLGRGDSEPQEFVTIANLNIREGPGTDFAKIQPTALAKGTRLSSPLKKSRPSDSVTRDGSSRELRHGVGTTRGSTGGLDAFSDRMQSLELVHRARHCHWRQCRREHRADQRPFGHRIRS